MATYGDKLACLRVAAVTGCVRPEVARWAAEALSALEPVAERLAERDRLLRHAAGLMSGSRWARACRLAREVEALQSPLRERAAEPDDGVREAVKAALAVAPGLSPPASPRHLLRVLSRSDVRASPICGHLALTADVTRSV